MSSPSRPPAGVPNPGSYAKYAVLAGLLLVGIGVATLHSWTTSPPAPLPPLPSASVVQTAEPAPNPKLDDIPPPPPPQEAPEGGSAPHTTVAVSGGCEGRCSERFSTPELTQAITVRAQQARRCYNQALAQDSTLKGKVSISVKVGPSGNVCSVGVASNDMGTPAVANCAANIFRNSVYPAPRGGCVEANVPLSFVSQQP